MLGKYPQYQFSNFILTFPVDFLYLTKLYNISVTQLLKTLNKHQKTSSIKKNREKRRGNPLRTLSTNLLLNNVTTLARETLFPFIQTLENTLSRKKSLLSLRVWQVHSGSLGKRIIEKMSLNRKL